MKATRLISLASLLVLNTNLFAASDNFASQMTYLGMSYDSGLERYDDSCMHGQETKVKQVRGNWKFTKVSNWNSISKSLGFPGKLAFIKYLMDADIKAEFVHSLRDNELTSSYLLASEFISSSSYLKDERIIRKAQADLAINGYQEFRSHCGDSYVSETTNGGRFLASVKLVFANQEVKDKFTVGLGAIPLKNAKLGLGVEKLSTKEKENSHMEIKLYQEGGRLSSLKNAVKSINPVSCKLSEWETCESLLKNIIDYSLNDFSKDVENGYTNVIGFKTSPYKIEHLKLDKEFRKQREEYIKLIDETLKLADRVELILKSQGYKLTANKKIAYNDILTDIKIRRDELFYNFSSCLRSKSNDINCANPSALDIPSLNKKLIYEKISWAVGPTVGGSGGKPHNLACNNYIQGFYGSHGNGLDQIGALCEDGNSTKMAASNVANPYIKTCDSGYLVTAFKASTGWVKRQKGLASFSFKCENIESIKASDNSDFYWIHSLFEDREKTFEWNCPAQTAASVIKGRSDSVINSFGLNCRGI